MKLKAGRGASRRTGLVPLGASSIVRSHGSGAITALTPKRTILDLLTSEECKAEMT